MPEDVIMVEIEQVTHVLDKLVKARDDLVVLVSYMAEHDYSAKDIAYAVEKPWKFLDVMALAVEEIERLREPAIPDQAGRLLRVVERYCQIPACGCDGTWHE